MFRYLVAICLLFLFLCSVGCRLCCSPYDYCIPAFIDRPDDYRGCGPLYRAGSILTGDGNGICQGDCGAISYVGDVEGYYMNAGNYGSTTPTSIIRPATQHPDEHDPADALESPSVPEHIPTLVKPQHSPAEVPIPGPYHSPNGVVPSVQELIEQPRRNTMPESLPMPITPPAKPKVESPTFENTPIESIPFSPNDEAAPSLPTAPEEDTPITLEELRRLDPSVSDLEIISIEDASTGTTIR